MKLEVNGATAYAYTGGKAFDPGLPCIAFVHGASNDHSVFTLLARWFAHHGHSVLAVDLPGHMKSGGALLGSVEAMADWLLALLQAAGVERAALVGHSMGSLIALEAAARAPERATALLMLGTAYPMKVSDSLLAMAASQPQRGMKMVNDWALSSHASKPSYPGPGHWLHGSGLALMERAQASAPAGSNLFLNDFQACHAYGGGLQAAALVRCPVTFVLGRQDLMTPPRATRELAAALKAQVTQIDAGHQMMAEAPDAVLTVVRAVVGAALKSSEQRAPAISA